MKDSRHQRPVSQVALLALLIAYWFDSGVLADAQKRAGYTFDCGLAVVGTVLLTKRGRASAVASTAEQAPQSEPA
jgi:hypothetical protein